MKKSVHKQPTIKEGGEQRWRLWLIRDISDSAMALALLLFELRLLLLLEGEKFSSHKYLLVVH